MNKPLYAFWKYDRFPFCLGGEILNMDGEGRVEVKGYGVGFWFKPFLILSLEAGKEKAATLHKLALARTNELTAIEQTFNNNLKSIITIPE